MSDERKHAFSGLNASLLEQRKRLAALEALTDSCEASWCKMPACGKCALCLTGYYRNCIRDPKCETCGGLGRVAKAQPETERVSIIAFNGTQMFVSYVNQSRQEWVDGHKLTMVKGSGSWETEQ